MTGRPNGAPSQERYTRLGISTVRNLRASIKAKGCTTLAADIMEAAEAGSFYYVGRCVCRRKIMPRIGAVINHSGPGTDTFCCDSSGPSGSCARRMNNDS
jgi:hypothetical protein